MANKKYLVGILAIVLASSLGFTSCGQRGGTVEIINDTTTARFMVINFDGVQIFGGWIDPAQVVRRSSTEDTTFAVFQGAAAAGMIQAVRSGTLSGGETHTIRISQLNWDW